MLKVEEQRQSEWKVTALVLLSKFGVVGGRRWEIWGKYDSGRLNLLDLSYESELFYSPASRSLQMLLVCVNLYSSCQNNVSVHVSCNSAACLVSWMHVLYGFV